MACRIKVENFQNTYYPGNTLVGKVICNFNSSVNFRGIEIKFRGREHTAWTESESYYDSSDKKTKYRTVHYTGDNKFLQSQITLAQEGSRNSGSYEFPFSFTLPLSLPSSFIGTYGSIKYYLKATVDIPWGFDYEDEKEFDVLAPIDFNLMLDIPVRPIEYEDEKTICCCCCASGPITMRVSLEKQAFIVGEKVKAKIYVKNLSNESILEIKLRIKMTIEYKTTSPRTRHKSDTELIAVSHETGVGAHGERIYNVELEIPQTAVVPNFILCDLFNQNSTLKIEAEIPGCHSNLDIEDSVVLGHIALTGTRVPLVDDNQFTALSPSATAPSPPDIDPPPYSSTDVPPYPSGPPVFPVPVSPNDIGFVIPGTAQGAAGPSQGVPSAPPEMTAPSAPSKGEMGQDDFEIIDNDNCPELPPPSYSDALKATAVQPP